MSRLPHIYTDGQGEAHRDRRPVPKVSRRHRVDPLSPDTRAAERQAHEPRH